MFVLKLVVVLSKLFFVLSTIIAPQETKNLELESCLNKILDRYTTGAFTIYINQNEKYKNLQLGPLPIIINNQLENLRTFLNFKVTFYVIVPAENLEETFSTLTRSHNWNPRAKFVVILDTLKNELFAVAQKYYVFNMVLLVPTAELVQVISYYPFGTSVAPVLIDNYIDNSTDLFPDKLPKTWVNTTVRLLLFQYPPYIFMKDNFVLGMEMDALKQIQSVLKFNMVYSKKNFTNWGRKLRNGSYEGAYSFFRNYEVDLGMGMFYINESDFWDFDETYPYMEDTVKWIVPMAKLQERWIRVIGIFSYEVWLLILIFFAWVSVLTFLAASACLNKEAGYERISDSVLKCYQCFLGQSAALPKKGVLRFAIGLWICFGLLITATFQGRLISVLNFNIREPQMTNIDELVASKIKFGVYKDTSYVFSRGANKNDWYIYHNHEECPVGSHCLDRIAFQGEFATYKPRKYIEYMISTTYLDKDGNSLMYVFHDTVWNLLISMIFTKGFPLYEKINLMLSWLKASGFIDHSYKKTAFNAKKAIESAKKSSFVFQVIDMKGVLWLFFFLLLGLTVAFVVFLGEVYVDKKKKSKVATSIDSRRRSSQKRKLLTFLK